MNRTVVASGKLGVLIALLLLPLSARAEDTGPFSPLTFRNGVQFRDPDDRYALNLRFRSQLGIYANSDLGADPGSISGQVRRLRLRVFGHVASPTLLYTLQFSFSRADMDWDNTGFPNVLRDATVVWRPSNRFQLSLGQTKLPGNRQRVVSSGEMQFADRSIVNRAFTIDRDFVLQSNFSGGLGLGDARGNLRLAVSNGEGRNIVNRDSGLAYTARAELLPFGDFTDGGDYFEGDLAGESSPKLSVGAGYSWNDRTRRTGGQLGREFGNDVSRSMGTAFADAVMKYRGFSLYLEAMHRHAVDPVVDAARRIFVLTGTGLMAQAGYFLSDRFELVARAAHVRPSSAVEALAPEQTQWTAGANYYLQGHRAKLQLDLTRNDEKNRSTGTTVGNWQGRFQLELGI